VKWSSPWSTGRGDGETLFWSATAVSGSQPANFPLPDGFSRDADLRDPGIVVGVLAALTSY